MTIEGKLWQILRQDDTGRGPASRASDVVFGTVVQRTTWEGDLVDWGMIYGMALALARLDDPFESLESVAERALEPARVAFVRWSGSFEERPQVFQEEAERVEREAEESYRRHTAVTA